MTFSEYKILAKHHNVVSITRNILADMITPVTAFYNIRQGSDISFLFESVEKGTQFTRYSFLGISPRIRLLGYGKKTFVYKNDSFTKSNENILDVLKKHTEIYNPAPSKDLPRFTGGFVGFLGYDSVRLFENIPAKNPTNLSLPDACFMRFDTILAFDHLKKQMILISNVFPDNNLSCEESYKDGIERLDKLEHLLCTVVIPNQTKQTKILKIESNLTEESFKSAVQKAKDYIREGDLFQIVLSQRFQTRYFGDSFQIYRALRSINPSPYLFFIDFGDYQIVGSSPELLVRVENRTMDVRPIAGTRKRGKTSEEDTILTKELLHDEKERAEHLMLIDLGRNDVGKVCYPGSVKVTEQMVIEKYSHVMHLVSNVRGKLQDGVNSIDALKSSFPSGTVSGAPKIRAMEIIDELENTRREIYAGAVGYIDFSGNLDTCIAIRTLLVKDGIAYAQAGAGIVSDSTPSREYEETVNKASVLLEAINLANKGLQ